MGRENGILGFQGFGVKRGIGEMKECGWVSFLRIRKPTKGMWDPILGAPEVHASYQIGYMNRGVRLNWQNKKVFLGHKKKEIMDNVLFVLDM